ncbi:MAG: hypothetical protein HZB39_19080 [Planctomycetes bacterium]|nr:hypothetical protein [Planctomycetota bacterium]
MRRFAIAGLLGAFAACSSAPSSPAGESPSGRELVVRLLPAEQVELDGRAMTFESFVYELRVACRAAAGDPSRRPWLRVLAPREQRTGDEELARKVRRAAYDAGVQHIELAMEGA